MQDKGNALTYFWEAVRKGLVAHFYLFCGDTRRHREQALALAASLNCRKTLKGDRTGERTGKDISKKTGGSGRDTGTAVFAGDGGQALSGGEPLFCGECAACRKIMSGCHPDVEFIRPAKTSIGIEQVVALQKKVSREPYEGDYKVYIIEEAEKLTLPAANALLVTAEEPADKTVLIMCCASDAAVLPTLRSRARTVFFPFEESGPMGSAVPEGYAETVDPIGILAEPSDEEGSEAWRLSGGNAHLSREVLRVGAARMQELTGVYDAAVEAGDFLRLFALFPLERETALVWLQVMAAAWVTGLRQEETGMEGEGSDKADEAALILPWIEDALRAVQRQADVRLTIEVLALKHMRGLNLWQR